MRAQVKSDPAARLLTPVRSGTATGEVLFFAESIGIPSSPLLLLPQQKTSRLARTQVWLPPAAMILGIATQELPRHT
jgi:hypothetical protein